MKGWMNMFMVEIVGKEIKKRIGFCIHKKRNERLG